MNDSEIFPNLLAHGLFVCCSKAWCALPLDALCCQSDTIC